MIQRINYCATRTGAKFHASNAFVRGIMGPVGSGKSVMCVAEILRRITEQQPDKYGIRRQRWAIARNTYPELKTTTLNTWKKWIPEEVCPIVMGAPIVGTIDFRLPDKTRVLSEIYFFPLDKVKDQKKLLSLDLTGVWLNEVREIPRTILEAATERVGRYPERDVLGWHGVIMDTNPPDDLSWYYHDAEVKTPPGWQFFKQPGGLIENPDGSYRLNPEAENIENLPPNYYLKAADGARKDRIRIMLMAQYGATFDGKAVYDGSYFESVHVAKKPLIYNPQLPLILGWDFGRTPACVVGQATSSGKLLILDEFYNDSSGVRNFAELVVRPALAQKYGNFRAISIGDPAGAAKSQANEASCFSEVEAAGFPVSAAVSNDPTVRIEAVIKPMSRMVAGEAGFLIDPACKRLIRGFAGGYHYEVVGKVIGGGEVRYNSQPYKNMYSHVHDALQYLALGFSPDTVAAAGQMEQQIARVMRQEQQRSENWRY